MLTKGCSGEEWQADLFLYNAVQVEACRSGMLYVVNVVDKDGNVLSEVAFNSQTGCIGANTLQVRHSWSPLMC